MPQEDSIKAQLKTKPFLMETEFLQYQQGQKLNNSTYLYWLNENGQKIKGRLLRQELFALKISLLNDGTNLFLV